MHHGFVLSIQIVATVALLASSGMAQAQDCNAIMVHGLRNIRVSKSTEASIATKYFNHCSKDFSNEADDVMARIEMEILGSTGYGSGSADFKRKQRQEKLVEWCKTNSEVAMHNKDGYEESQTIYGQAVDAWQNCNLLLASGVMIETRITPDSRTVQLSLSYRGNTPTGIKFYGVDSEGFTCTIDLPSKGRLTLSQSKPIEISHEAIAIVCKRQEATKTIDKKEYLVLSRGVLNIKTASHPFQIYFPPESTPAAPLQELQARVARLESSLTITPPPGTVIAYLGSSTPDGYVVCNGQRLNKLQQKPLFGVLGYDFLQLGEAVGGDSFRVPDCQGMFLRGLQGDRKDGHGDPDVRVMGKFQADAIGQHAHSFAVAGFSGPDAASPISLSSAHTGNDRARGATFSGTTANNAGTETRPQNIAVRYLIKL